MLSHKISFFYFILLMYLCISPPLCFASNGGIAGLGLTPEEGAWLKTHPVIRIGTMANWPPLNFVNDNGQPAGISADYIRLLNKSLNGALTLVPGPFKKNFDLVKQRQLGALMDITPKAERRTFFNFTRPYLKIPHVIVGRKDGPYFSSEKELEGKTLGLEKGFYNVTYFKNNFPNVRLREYRSTEKVLGAVSRSEVDAYAGNRAVAIHLIEKELMGNLQIQGRMDKPPVVLSIGTRKDWPELASILDKALASMTTEEERRIRNKWLGIEPRTETAPELPRTVSPEQVGYVLKRMAAVFAVIFTAIFLFWLANGRPRKFSIRATLFGILFVFSGLTVSIGVFAVLLLNLDRQLAEVEVRRNDFMGLAHEIKQSSDDLTRFARTFVVTENPVYESYFLDILDIRDGIIPHPANNTPAFWDHVAAGVLKPEYRGETYSIEQRMHELGLSREEHLELSLAKKKSDELTSLETVGMNAIKGLFDNGHGNFTIVKKPDREMARRLLHGDQYHKAKTGIMKHIDNYLLLIKKRTTREVGQAQDKATAILLAIMALTCCAVLFAFFSFFLLKRRIIAPLYLLKSGARRLERGDYTHHIDIGTEDEAGDLAGAFNAMTDSIKERTARLHSIIDTAVDAIVVVSSKGIVETFSPAAEEMFGHSAKEIIGRNVSVLMPETIAAAHDQYICRYLETKEPRILGKRVETVARKRNGEIFPVNISISRATVGRELFFTGIIRDITHRKEAEKELRESEVLHRLLAECSADMIVQYSLDGKVMYASPAARSLTGFSPKDLLGQSVYDLSHPAHHEDIRKAMDHLMNQAGMVVLKVRMKRNDGSSRWVETVCQPVVDTETEEIKAILGVSRDITEQKLLEDARLSSLKLNQMADKASLGDLLEQGLEEGVRLTESTVGYFHFVDPEHRTIEMQAWSEEIRSECSVGEVPLHYPFDESEAWAACILKKAPVIHNDRGTAPPFSLTKNCIPSIRHMAAPIFEYDDVVAVIGVGNKSRDYVPYDVEILSLLGENIRSIVRRKINAATIVRNEARLKLVLKGGNLGYWDTNLKMRSTVVNDLWAGMFGYRLDEIPDAYRLWNDSLHPDDRQTVRETAGNYLAGKTDVYEVKYRIITRNKKIKWLISRGAVVEWEKDKTPLRMVGTLLDITETKKIEEELRRNMEDLRKFSEIAVDREERMIDLKQEVNALLGRLGQEGRYKIR